MIRYAIYFAAAFVALVALPAVLPIAGDTLPLHLFYTPFLFLADRLYGVLPVDALRHPLVVLGIGALFWAMLGAFTGVFLKLWPFRSFAPLRFAVATATFFVCSWVLYSTAQLVALLL